MGIKNPYEDCPRFDSCSAPKCPLDPEYHTRHKKEKGEEICKALKSTRLRIAKAYPEIKLPYQGMTAREFSGFKASQCLETQI